MKRASWKCDFFGSDINTKFVHNQANDCVNLSVYSGLSASSSSRTIETGAAMLAVALRWVSQVLFQIQDAYKLSEDFAKPYFHKYWTAIHDVTTIWKMNVCNFIVTLNALDVRPTCDTADVQTILPFPPNPLKHSWRMKDQLDVTC